MSASYDQKLSTNLDWVRFLVGDTDVAKAQLDDEEIHGILNDQTTQHGGRDSTDGTWVRYLAAAEILEGLSSKWIAAGAGVVEKQVSKLRIRRGISDSREDVFKNRVNELRLEGARRRQPRPRTFEVL